MKLQELLENANLAALGLLDAEEQHAFDKALAAAQPAVRRHVLAEQERWSGGGALLPDVQPPASLRDRVLDAVHANIMDAELESTASSLDFAELSAGQVGGVRKVAPWWRAGAIALAAACVVLSASFLYVVRSNDDSSSRHLARALCGNPGGL
jgi:hypothetical protein